MGATTNVQNVFGKPAHALVGDPTPAAGAGLVDLSSVQRATIQKSMFRQAVSNEVGQPLQAFGTVKHFDITLQLFSAQASFLAGLFPEVTANGEALTFSEDPAVLVFPTLIIVPEAEFGQAAASDYVWYFPRVFAAQDPGQWIFKVEESLTSGEPFSVTLRTLRTVEDQGQTALPAGKQIGFRGAKPAGWSLPAAYG